MLTSKDFIDLFKLKNSENDIEWNTHHLVDLIEKLYTSLSKNVSYKEIYDLTKLPRNKKFYFLDAGANVGVVTILVGYFFPKAKILSIEASPTTFKTLSNNIDIFSKHIPNLKERVFLFNNALSSKNGDTLTFYEKVNFSVGSTISINHAEHDKNVFSADYKKVEVKTIDLNTLLKNKKIRMAKIDIEYGEYDLFNSIINNKYNSKEKRVFKKIKKLNFESHGEHSKQRELKNALANFYGRKNIGFEMQGIEVNYTLGVKNEK